MTEFEAPSPAPWRFRGGSLDFSRARVMGIVNVTPDSFSDGGRFADPPAACRHAETLVREGADLLDVGGESTRPGADPVPEAEEIRRVVPVVREAARLGVPVSVDTSKPAVAREALEAGAAVVNDVTALADPAMAPLVAESGAGLILMHMLGTPRTMQDDPRYEDLMGEVVDFLAGRRDRAEAAGVGRAAIVLDPGIGFGKRAEHNLEILRRLSEVAALGSPVLVGASRKRFIGAVTGVRDPGERTIGSTAAAVAARLAGASLLRVHDVGATRQALSVADAILGAG
jgi:dihydropteroate synthase